MGVLGHQINKDEDKEVGQIKKLLCGSREIETDFLEPYLHFVQTSANTLNTTRDWEYVECD